MAESITGFRGTNRQVRVLENAFRKGWFTIGESDPDADSVAVLFLPQDLSQSNTSLEKVAATLSGPLDEEGWLSVFRDEDGETAVYYEGPATPGFQLLIRELISIREG